MRLNKIATLTTILGTLCLSSAANAFNVDKMIVVADEKGNGIVNLINDEAHPLFVKSHIQEIRIDNGSEIVRTDYSRENLTDWKVSLTNSKLVLKPGEEKSVGIRSLCHQVSCDNSKDLMFMLPFTPSRYNPTGEKLTGVEINYGFSPLYIIPTTEPRLDYKLFNQGEELRVVNNSNTMINVYVDSCNDDNKSNCKQKYSVVKSNCKQKYSVVSGRDKTFPLAKNMQSERLDVTVTSYDKKYSNEMELDIQE
ncbi:hypothetical protein F0231_09520 [Vibrio sp. RE86]|uniref:hypothetical protein n=1 Tax=Vibrio sp. RE86 TaxID=2607605 RepID=UPI0014933905|nr:hypothetical protein [Vibrio sp. RE86]NOH79979.1 hypothetical protein [Vibrio sp. RE86]